jgi:hypothetical protein
MKSPHKLIILIFTLLSTLSACRKEPAVQLSEDILERTAQPEQTDTRITTTTFGNKEQFAYLPKEAMKRKDKLFIFIPGTFAGPNIYTRILKSGAKYGYYSIGISYSNNQTIQSFCTGNNQNCVSNIFREYLEGVNYSPEVDISSANSLENRISKFILYLKNNYPDENWGRFLNTDHSIKWEKISLAGHSQGSGHVLYISKTRNLLRASLFSGPNGFKLANGQFPNWLSSNGLTTNAKVFCFSNSLDAIADWAEIQVIWNNIGISGSFQNVDNAGSFNGAQKLYTNIDLPPAIINPEHGSTVANDNTPLDNNGRAVFERVWKYMCFPD